MVLSSLLLHLFPELSHWEFKAPLICENDGENEFAELMF